MDVFSDDKLHVSSSLSLLPVDLAPLSDDDVLALTNGAREQRHGSAVGEADGGWSLSEAEWRQVRCVIDFIRTYPKASESAKTPGEAVSSPAPPAPREPTAYTQLRLLP